MYSNIYSVSEHSDNFNQSNITEPQYTLDNTCINQIDGNMSLPLSASSASSLNSSSSTSQLYEEVSCPVVDSIPVIIGNRPSRLIKNDQEDRKPRSLTTIKRSNRVLQSLSLPTISSYNMRSLLPKLDSYAEDFEDRDTGVSFLTEIWTKADNNKHQNKLHELFEMKGLLYISTPRPGLKRGGGVAIVADPIRFSLSKFSVPNPHKIEVTWGLLRPKVVTGKISKIICCAFYSPPYSKKKTKLIDHLSSTLQDLLLDHPGAAIVIAGDRNDLSVGRILSIESSLQQIVSAPTHGRKILDVVFTNIWKFYNDPVIVSPIPVDDPSKGVPSDHLGVVVEPIQHPDKPPLRRKKIINFRPKPQSKICNFGKDISQISWDFLSSSSSSTELTEAFQRKMTDLIDTHFPLKSITVTEADQPWITKDLKSLKRTRIREYCRHGKSTRYYDLKKQFKEKQEVAVKHYTDKIINEVKAGTKASGYKALRKLGVRKGDTKDELFVLPAHNEQNLTEEEVAERIADYFSSISQEFESLEMKKLPPNVKSSIEGAKGDPDIPVLEAYEVYKKILKAKKPDSVIHGDIPKDIVKLFSPELAEPVAIIFNKISSSFEYPRPWIKESQIAVPKVFPPTSEDDLRPLSRTFFFSKVYESFIAEWLLPVILPYMDPGQYGMKGSSIVHYLLRFLHFIHSSLDLKQPHAVLAVLVDLNKAFNRVSHIHVIQDLYDMHAPGWILAILCSYLSGRSMTMSYGQATSTPRRLPGSTPQGALLGGLIFIVKYNGACLRPVIPRPVLRPVPRPVLKPVLAPIPPLSVKFVDDHSCAVRIDLKKSLVPDPLIRQRPLKYHERTEHVLPLNNNLLQLELEDLKKFTVDNLMKINESKTKIMLFITSHS